MSAKNHIEEQAKGEKDSIIVYEYKIEGMTCVNCSSAIENGMINEFKAKGLVKAGEGEEMATTGAAERQEFSVSVILLMHKMKISFYKKIAE